MSMSIPTIVRHVARAAASAVVLVGLAAVAGPAADDALVRVAASLAEPAFTEIESARRDVQAAVATLRRELGERALGVVLHEELEIDRLVAELARPLLDADALGSLERPLRRVLAGRVQATVDRLRGSLMRLTRLVRLVPENIAVARKALAMLTACAGGAPASAELDDDLRRGFLALAATSPARHDLEILQRHLSRPNVSTFVSGSFLEHVSRKHVEKPVDFRETKDGARIAGGGRVRVALSATAPPTEGANMIRLHAAGSGSIDATADRRRVHVRATATPCVTGDVDLRLLPDRIDEGTPRVDAAFRTQLTGLRIDGALGSCGIVRRLAGRIISEVLAANDPRVADRIEKDVAGSIEEEGSALAHRINGLLRHGMWDRLVALDYAPAVRAWNDTAGMHADTLYAHGDQLGALRPPPAIPPTELRRLDVVTRVHESAINNTLASLGGLKLDENTVRGIWEVQLKLSSTTWDALPPGRVPAVITLADHEPAAVRFRDLGLDVVLRATSCAVDGRVVDEGPREIRFRYQLERDAAGMRFVRREFAHAGTVPAEKVAAWDRALGLFFGTTLMPLPRYRPSAFAQELRTSHLDVADGWLTVGAIRAEPAAGTAQETTARIPHEVHR